MQVRLDRNVVHEDAEEPIEAEHACVHVVAVEVRAQPRKFFVQQLLENFLNEEKNQIKSLIGQQDQEEAAI